MGYTKLFSSIVASTIWRMDDKTRLVWITMLALKNEKHVVEASVPGLADLARVSLEECQEALRKLEEPDEWSRNKEHGGKRIAPVAGGWLILNGEYYRRLMSLDDRREYQRVYQAEYRKRNKSGKPLPGEQKYEQLEKEDGPKAASAFQAALEDELDDLRVSRGKGAGTPVKVEAEETEEGWEPK